MLTTHGLPSGFAGGMCGAITTRATFVRPLGHRLSLIVFLMLSSYRPSFLVRKTCTNRFLQLSTTSTRPAFAPVGLASPARARGAWRDARRPLLPAETGVFLFAGGEEEPWQAVQRLGATLKAWRTQLELAGQALTACSAARGCAVIESTVVLADGPGGVGPEAVLRAGAYVRSEGGHRPYAKADTLAKLGQRPGVEKTAAIDTRVSTRKQAEARNLERQQLRLVEYAALNG